MPLNNNNGVGGGGGGLVNADEAVAYGAAIQAAILSGAMAATSSPPLTLTDRVPLSLGVAVEQGAAHNVMSDLIRRNSVVPTAAVGQFTTVVDNQKAIVFQVGFYDGKYREISDINLLDGFANLPSLLYLITVMIIENRV